MIQLMATEDARDLIRANAEELRAFLSAGHGESETLEYKQDLSGDISRTVAAMADSEGGTIVVGVVEDRRTKTPRLYDGFVSTSPLDQLNGHPSTFLAKVWLRPEKRGGKWNRRSAGVLGPVAERSCSDRRDRAR